MSDQETQIKHAQEVLTRHAKDLMSRPGVVAVGVGLRQRGGALTDQVAIVVTVHTKRAQADLLPDQALPTELEGVPVDVQESGEISAI